MKNLLIDPWLPIVRRDGSRAVIAICDIVEGYKTNPIINIEAPRPDLRNGIFQLLVGLLQVMALPDDEDAWEDLWEEPYSANDLRGKFTKYASCFCIDNLQGPAFMQDYDWERLAEAKDGVSVASLLIDAPGANTRKENKDHFVKRGQIEVMDPYWAAIALYTLQTFAPAGGQGHRVGLRGGGPLTTIVLPKEKDATLWEKVWLNIFNQKDVQSWPGYMKHKQISDIFPWMGPTRTSMDDEITTPDDCHPFQMYFGTPRRIRLNFTATLKRCELSGRETDAGVSMFHTLPKGVNYNGPWLHPLNSYSVDPNKPEEGPLSQKGQPGGISYRHWLGLSRKTERYIPAKVVSHLDSDSKRSILGAQGGILWVAGYDMDNAKARCWYESTLPLYSISPANEVRVTELVEAMIAAASESAQSIRSCIKQSWFDRPKDAKGDISFLDTSFWQNTEPPFYSILQQLIEKPFDDIVVPACIVRWEKELRKEAFQLFDKWALSMSEDGLDMRRVVNAREFLGKNINKAFKGLQNIKNPE